MGSILYKRSVSGAARQGDSISKLHTKDGYTCGSRRQAAFRETSPKRLCIAAKNAKCTNNSIKCCEDGGEDCESADIVNCGGHSGMWCSKMVEKEEITELSTLWLMSLRGMLLYLRHSLYTLHPRISRIPQSMQH